MKTTYHTTNRIIARCSHKQVMFETFYNPGRDDACEAVLEIETTDDTGCKQIIKLTRNQVETWQYLIKTMKEYM